MAVGLDRAADVSFVDGEKQRQCSGSEQVALGGRRRWSAGEMRWSITTKSAPTAEPCRSALRHLLP
jgi:hypothetical protein